MRLKDKFSQLKQSRARREEKKQSTSWDGDSVSSKALTEDEATSESDCARAKSLSRKGSRSRIHSDTSEDESFNVKLNKIKRERFLESDIELGFADSEEKHLALSNQINSSILVNHVRIKDEPRTSEDEDKMSLTFHPNMPMIVNNHESRKKSHKKKQKRQKNSISSSEENVKLEPCDNLDFKTMIGVNHVDVSPSHLNSKSATHSEAEDRVLKEKKQRNKKEKRRDRNSESKLKARRKRLNRQEARDSQIMEDIFGPLSDVDEPSSGRNVYNKLPTPDDMKTTPGQNHMGYHSDSEGGRSPLLDRSHELERAHRKSEKKRKELLARDDSSMELAAAGREIEAKLLGLDNSPKSTPSIGAESTDHDVFRFTDCENDSVEHSTPNALIDKSNEKKKKRKKSRQERSRKDGHHHHHHHHHHHYDPKEHEKTSAGSSMPLIGAEITPPRSSSSPAVSRSLSPAPSNHSACIASPRDSMPSPIKKATSTESVADADNSIESDKKKDKLIPGFGLDVDESVHENAVKSISEPDISGHSITIGDDPVATDQPLTPPAPPEDKTRAIISQEETEDAVAALLEETFGEAEGYSYDDEESEEPVAGAAAVAAVAVTAPDTSPNAEAATTAADVEEIQQAVDSLNAEADLKPDTPQSEHDLQIDTDNEDDSNLDSAEAVLKVQSLPPVSEKTLESLATTSSASPVISNAWLPAEAKTSRELTKVPRADAAEPNACASQPEASIGVIPHYHHHGQNESSKTLNHQPAFQRLPVSPQGQIPPYRQASLRTPVTSSIPTGTSGTRISEPPSPNATWARTPSTAVRIPVSVPLSSHCSDAIYSAASTQPPQQAHAVIQHAPGMRAAAANYPRSGLPPLALSVAPTRPYVPCSQPNTPKAIIDTLIAVSASEPAPRMSDEPKLSAAAVAESTEKVTTSPKVPSPNQAPTFIPETAKIGPTNAGFTKHAPLLAVRQKQELERVQSLAGTHVPQTLAKNPVIVAHGQQQMLPSHSIPIHPLSHQTKGLISHFKSESDPIKSECCLVKSEIKPEKLQSENIVLPKLEDIKPLNETVKSEPNSPTTSDNEDIKNELKIVKEKHEMKEEPCDNEPSKDRSPVQPSYIKDTVSRQLFNIYLFLRMNPRQKRSES